MIRVRLTKGAAIRAYCKECMCGQLAEVRKCPSEKCPLFPYRMGKEDTSHYSDEIKHALQVKSEKAKQRQLSPVKIEECEEEEEEEGMKKLKEKEREEGATATQKPTR